MRHWFVYRCPSLSKSTKRGEIHVQNAKHKHKLPTMPTRSWGTEGRLEEDKSFSNLSCLPWGSHPRTRASPPTSDSLPPLVRQTPPPGGRANKGEGKGRKPHPTRATPHQSSGTMARQSREGGCLRSPHCPGGHLWLGSLPLSQSTGSGKGSAPGVPEPHGA